MLQTLQSTYGKILALLVISTFGAISTVAPWLIVSTYARPILLALLVIATLETTRQIQPTQTSTGRWIFGVLHALVFVAFFTTLWSVDPIETLIKSSSLAALVLIIQRISTRRWQDKTIMEEDFRLVFVISSLVLASGVLAHYLGILPLTFSGRFQGFINNPNMAALVSVPVLFIGWGLFWERRKLWDFLWLAPSATTIILTQTRTAILAVSAAAVWLLIRSGWRGVKNATFLGIFLSVIVTTFGKTPFLFVYGRFGEESGNDQLSGRTFIWADAIEIIKNQPYGYGWGTTRAVGEYFDTRLSFHNSYLEVAIQGGIAALLVVIIVYLALMTPLFRTPANGLAAGLSGAIVAGFVLQFAESSIFGVGQPYAYIYWMCVGGLLTLYSAERKDLESELSDLSWSSESGERV